MLPVMMTLRREQNEVLLYNMTRRKIPFLNVGQRYAFDLILDIFCEFGILPSLADVSCSIWKDQPRVFQTPSGDKSVLKIHYNNDLLF